MHDVLKHLWRAVEAMPLCKRGVSIYWARERHRSRLKKGEMSKKQLICISLVAWRISCEFLPTEKFTKLLMSVMGWASPFFILPIFSLLLCEKFWTKKLCFSKSILVCPKTQSQSEPAISKLNTAMQRLNIRWTQSQKLSFFSPCDFYICALYDLITFSSFCNYIKNGSIYEMILWCSFKPYFKSLKIITDNTSILLYGRHSISMLFQRTTWKLHKVIKEPLLFENKKLFSASYPELTAQGHLLHAMSLGSLRSKWGKMFVWFFPAHTPG